MSKPGIKVLNPVLERGNRFRGLKIHPSSISAPGTGCNSQHAGFREAAKGGLVAFALRVACEVLLGVVFREAPLSVSNEISHQSGSDGGGAESD